ncbi:hypothetical protein FALBO_15747 [Fusarium albosuccineum]|uniref:NACHT domain-containing protein n=1 Tax=Fusarium albosuccineum TaxID=1237068 RepID=A0A8H4KP42_9HYPO|nr:hypothetical protein FALBO_15747 [Fusarium albosuccineum]
MPQSPGSSQPPLFHPDTSAFGAAANSFLSTLTVEHYSLFSPTDFRQLKESVQHIVSISNGKIHENKICNVLSKLHDALEPYFKVVGIFVSAKPEFAAFVWGAMRLILQLASNFTTFFEKLTSLLEHLALSFSQYGEIHKHCASANHLKHSRIPSILKLIYSDIFRIFQSCIQIFVRRDGRTKKTVVITGSLMWKSFDSRFQDQLSSLSAHRKDFFEELAVSQMSSSIRDAARDAATNNMIVQFTELSTEEIESARKERDLAQKEREIRAVEIRDLNEGSKRLEQSLLEIQEALWRLESERMNKVERRIREWLSPPRFKDAFDQAKHARQSSTASWIFQEDQYQAWLETELSAFQPANVFGPNVLWIHGNPGSGKTILASSIVESLQSQQHSRPKEIYYYFFDHRSLANSSACSAYRSLSSQIICFNQHEKTLLDKFSFVMSSPGENQGQLEASKAAVMDLLDLSLSSDSILVLDGIDECVDSDEFVASLLEIWKTNLPHIIFLSRVNVASLRRYVPETYQLQMSKSKVSEDIRVFSDFRLVSLFNNSILSPSSSSRKADMVDRMVYGSNGMFLWARLMINFLESPYLDESEKMSIFNQINTPEGLEMMYCRIVKLILASGKRASGLASAVLLRLIHAPVPLSSSHIWQSLVVDGSRVTPRDTAGLEAFENSIIMACGGLIERTALHDPPSVFVSEPSLRLIHLSVSETLTSFHSIPSLLGWGEAELPIVADQAIGGLDCATVCLKQLLYHMPRQPLSGALGTSIDGTTLYNFFCFSDYAAVSWLLHLEDFIRAASAAISLFQGTWSPRFQQALYDFYSSFATFLQTPAAITAWFEAFYTYPYQHLLAHPLLSPLDGLALWAKQAVSLDVRVPFDSKFVTDVESFRAEVHNAVSLWGISLRARPCTVWDEMTGFMDSNRFFWSSNSTRLTYQQPMAPMQLMPSQEPAALMSKTSGSGELKATLCIWGNALYHDSTVKERAWQNLEGLDLTDLCCGWVATYGVWKIQPDTVRLAQGEILIQPHELWDPMRNYLNVRGPSMANLPLAINSQLNTFVILGTLYSLKASLHRSEPNCQSCPLPIQLSATGQGRWTPIRGQLPWPDTHSVTFPEGSEHLALLESNETGQQSITVCQYAYAQSLNLEVLNVVKTERGMKRIEKVIFHPSHNLIAFCVFSSIRTTTWQNAAFLWAYRTELPRIFPLSHGHMFEPVGFSSCGLFFVTRSKYSARSPVVLEIPPRLLDATKTTVPETAQRNSSTVTEHAINAIVSLASNQSTSTEVWKVDDDKNVSSVAVQASESGICVTGNSRQGTQTSSLVTLPMWQGAGETTQRVMLPQFQGDSLKISVDVDTQTLCPGSTYQLSKAGGNVKPAVIYRDPRFIALNNLNDSTAQSLAWPAVQQSDVTGEGPSCPY